MTDKEKRKEQILMKAHELAKSAKPLVDNMPLSTIIAATIEMAEWCDANPVKDPVSEDLNKEIEIWQDYYAGKNNPIQRELIKQVARHFSLWQKEQFEKNRLKHCNSITNEQAELEQGFIDQHLDKYQRMPTFLDAIEYGMKLKEQQMMKDAIDATLLEGHLIRQSGITHPLHNGDKVKVIIVKED